VSEPNQLTVRGRKIHFDENGLACLGDIHRASGFSKNQKPGDWLRLETTQKLINAVLKKATGKSHSWTKSELRSVLYSKNGVGTFAEVRLALSYAEYLNPALALEVKEVFLRYKGGDPTLADEVLEKATSEANEWVARRAMGRVIRNEFTKELDRRGIQLGWQYGAVTNETYLGLFDKRAADLKLERSVPANGNLRDKMSMAEIAFVAASEALSVERMQDEEAQGYKECKTATSKASLAIRSAIERDRKDRQKRLA
jgi:hypothetical protein